MDGANKPTTKRNVHILGWLILVLALPVFVVGLFPRSYQVCPDWEVTVVDVAGAPVSGMTVRRSCQDYSVEARNHEDDAITDERGKASFKGRYLQWPFLVRWAGNLLNVASQGVHASFGRHANVWAFGREMEGVPVVNGYVEDWTGSPEHMDSRIVVKPVEVSVPHFIPR